MLDQRYIDAGHHEATSRDAVLISIDLDGRILGWSPSAEQMFGIPACDIVGSQLAAVIFEAPDSARRARLRAAVEMREILDGTSTFMHRSGAAIDVHVTAVPVIAASGWVDRVDLILTRLERVDLSIPVRVVEERIAELARACSLDARDVEVLVLLATGHRVATIARHLHLAHGTVRNRLSALYVKLGVRCQGEVVELLLGERAIDGRHGGAA